MIPTAFPTVRPSEDPSSAPSASPTLAPTAPLSFVFEASQTLSGIEYDETSDTADDVVNVIEEALETSLGGEADVTVLSITTGAGTTTFSNYVRKKTLDSALVVDYIVEVPSVQALGFEEPSEAYDSVSSRLHDATMDGTVTQNIVALAETYAVPVSNISAESIEIREPLYPTFEPTAPPTFRPTTKPSDSASGASGGASGGMSIGVVVGAAAGGAIVIALIGYYAFSRFKGMKSHKTRKEVIAGERVDALHGMGIEDMPVAYAQPVSSSGAPDPPDESPRRPSSGIAEASNEPCGDTEPETKDPETGKSPMNSTSQWNDVWEMVTPRISFQTSNNV